MNTTQNKNKLRVLLAEDDPITRMAMSMMIERIDNIELVTAEDGAIAFEIFTSGITEGSPVNVVLSDYRMPNMKGSELARRVAQSLRPPYFVLMSADSIEEIDPEKNLPIHKFYGKAPVNGGTLPILLDVFTEARQWVRVNQHN